MSLCKASKLYSNSNFLRGVNSILAIKLVLVESRSSNMYLMLGYLNVFKLFS